MKKVYTFIMMVALMAPVTLASDKEDYGIEDGNTVEDILGNYVWTYDLEITEDAGRKNGQINILPVEGSDCHVSIYGLYPITGVVLDGIYNSATRTLYIPHQNAFVHPDYGQAYFYFGKWGNSSDDMIPLEEPMTALFDGSTFTFAEMDLMLIGAPEVGWYLAADFNKWTKFDSDSSDWVSVGKARFQDGWIAPKYNINQSENIYEVELQRSKDDENVYRLVNPYAKGSGSPVAEKNTASGLGYIQFDVSDPEHVLFTPVSCGFGDRLSAEYYLYNTLAYGCYMLDTDPESLINMMGDALNATTFKDGVISLPFGDACLGIVGNVWGGYKWTDENNQRLDMTARIWFPGASSVITVSEDLTVDNVAPEYYSIDGVRLDNPCPGQLVIVREGNRTYKTVIR